MAKTARLKASNKAPSPHSRLSRRASSPSLNLDRSLTSLPRALTAGISKRKEHGSEPSRGKKTSKGKPLSHRQRVRVSRGKDRAVNVGERMERRREKGGGKGRGRAADWDELNQKIAAEIGGKGKGKRKAKAKGKTGWKDEDEDEKGRGDMDGDGGKKEALHVKSASDEIDSIEPIQEQEEIL